MSLAAAFEGSTGLNEAHRREIEGRVGTAGGRAVRSFHINFGSVKASEPAARGWSQAIDYAARQGKYAEDGEELEEGPDVQHVAGSPDALREACKTIDAGVRQRRGKTAERILVKETVELPSDVEDEQAAWKAGAEAIVADWRKRGHEAVAAVHLHGEERDHPHLHVLVAARPVNADGGVDRSRRLLVGKAAVKAERANAAERINEACEPKIHFHPGKLKEIGIERAAKKRIPQGEFRARRAEIRAAPEKAAAIEASMYAMSAAERAPLHVERTARYEARKPIIEAAKAAGRWPPISRLREQQILTRSWRVTYEDMKAEKQKAWDDANYWIVEGHKYREERDEQRARADTAGGRARELEELNKRQTKYVTDWHADREVEPPDLATVEGQSEAWANMRAWEIEERKRRKDEAVAKKAEIEEIARERDEAVQQAAAAGASPELVERAEQAEAERDALATGLGLTPEQVAQAARRAEGELAKAARQAREQAATALQPHCMPIWRAHLVTSKRLADAVFDEGAEAAEALVRDPDRAGTVLANPDLSGVEELVAAIREADASRPRRTLTLQERAERAESAAAAEAELARAAELERDRAQEARREARGKLSEMEAALRDATRQRNDARAALESAGIDVQAAEEEARKQRAAKAQAEEAERQRAVAAADAKAERQRRLDARRSRWTRERQAREKYGYKREEMEGKRWSSDADMAHSYKHQFDQEARLIEVIDRKSYVLDDDARDRTEAVAVQDLLYEFAGRLGVDFGHGVVAPAWRIGCDVFLDHARTVAQDENGDRVHVAFPRVAGAPELVYDREQERWDYRHPEAQHSYWMKAEDAAGWEAAARIAHYASVRDALKRSDPVPDKVLADYPDLAPKPQQDKPKTPPAPENEADKPPASRRRDRDRDEGR